MNLIHNLTQQEAEQNLDKQVQIIRQVFAYSSLY